MRFFPVFLLVMLLLPVALTAQQGAVRIVRGQVTDAETTLPLSQVSVSAMGSSRIRYTDEAGRYEIRLERHIHELRFERVGHRMLVLPVGTDSLQTLDVALEPENRRLREVTIKPKKYRNKDNPAVELIRLVIENRDKNRIENLTTYQDEQYEKIIFGLGKVTKRLKNHFLLKPIRFIWENVDTVKMAGTPVTPLFLQENMYHFYSQNPPKQQKKYLHSVKSVRFGGAVDDEGADKSVQYLFQGIDIYDNNITLVTNQFASPISNNAPLLYRYYPMDTFVENGQKIVRLEFYPRNKADMLLQGDLFVALDSTYPVTRVRFTVNPNVNLNWVQWLQVEQEFDRDPSTGRRILAREDYRMYLGLFSKKLMGMFGQRFVEHRAIRINEPLPSDTLFNPSGKIVVLPNADRSKDSVYWNATRVPLNPVEILGYENMDSILRSPWYRRMTRAMRLMAGGFVDLGPKVELGPMHNFYAFNGVEGNRYLLLGRTTPKFSKKWQIEGQVQYGALDRRWKGAAGLAYALGPTAYNKFPLSLLRFNYASDLRIPGQNQFINNFIGTSIVRGSNDKLLYWEQYKLQYEREYKNNFSWMAGLEREELNPAGALRFEPVDANNTAGRPVTSARFFAQVRYAPGETFMQGQNGIRLQVAFRFIAQLRYTRGIKGLLGGDYHYDDVYLFLQKFTNTPPLGYNRLSLEAGGVFGKVPYPLLTIHRANQSYLYQDNAYNLMNFMEFISDRYVGLNVNHFFNGFFLNKIPLVKKLKLREVATMKLLYGAVSSRNRPDDGSGLYRFPTLPDGTPITYTLERKPYLEASIGISNIFKIIRIDYVRRFNYLNLPGTTSHGIRAKLQVEF